MNLRSCSIAIVFFVLASSSIAMAARGPCSVTKVSTSASNIGCSLVISIVPTVVPPFIATNSDCLCTGVFAIWPQQKACADTDESECTPMGIDSVVTYTSMNAAGVPGGNCGWVVQFCGGTCVQDVTSRIGTPGGSNC